MTIVCKMLECPYHDVRGFCGKPTVIRIDQLGTCSVIWKRGQRKIISKDKKVEKNLITIQQAETVIVDTKQLKVCQEGGSHLEDPQNGATA